MSTPVIRLSDSARRALQDAASARAPLLWVARRGRSAPQSESPPLKGGPMKWSTFTDEQVLAIVKEGETGRKVAGLHAGITEQTNLLDRQARIGRRREST
jgi:hypothetical protein